MQTTLVKGKAAADRPDVIGRIEAVVIDERREPVEQVTGVRPVNVSADELALDADFPLIPGSHLLVQVGDRHAKDAARKRIEVEVLGCDQRPRGHRVITRLVQGTMPRELLKAA